jgi:hypothetical protein
VFHALVGIFRLSCSSRITFIGSRPSLTRLTLLAQSPTQHGNASAGCREVFEGVHCDRPLPFLDVEVIRLTLAIFVTPREDRARPDVLDSIGSRPPILLGLAVPPAARQNDAQSSYMFVVDWNRPISSPHAGNPDNDGARRKCR